MPTAALSQAMPYTIEAYGAATTAMLMGEIAPQDANGGAGADVAAGTDEHGRTSPKNGEDDEKR